MKDNIISFIYFIINNIPFNNRKKINSGNTIKIKGIMIKSKIKILGSGNIVEIEKESKLNNCSIFIIGNNNKIMISKGVYSNKTEFYIENDNGVIFVGENSVLNMNTHLAVIEGKKISIGKNCLFSSNLIFRVGDSHSVLDMNGNRINPSADITIKDHVWIGYDVKINKGVVIEENSIVATGSVLTKKIDKSNVVIGGVPAKIVKENVNWCAQRIKVEGQEV